MERRFSVLLVLVAVCLAISASDATQVVEKLKTRIRAPVTVMPSSNSVSAAENSAATIATPAESSKVESIAATKLQGSENSCESSTSCSGAIKWGNIGSSSSSSSNDVGSVDDAVGPVAAWIKAFKKKVGASNDDLVGAAKAIVTPLIDKLKANQQRAEERLEQSNEQILDTVERSVTEHVLKLLRAEKIQEDRQEQSEARAEKRAEASEKEELRHLESSASEDLASRIAQSINELSQSSQSKSILEHVSQELAAAKKN